MKSKDWAAIMRVHPVFAMLSEDQRAQLLHADVSTEITYEKDETIIRQGELGRSVFLLSDGSAAVTMRRGGGDEAELYSIGYGELFGEMALIEERPRAASVKANDISIVLEIDGLAFVSLLKSEPEIAFMLLGKLSRRLRFTNTKVMEQRISGLDETVNVMNSRVDSMLAKTEAHLTASKVIFDQTKQSASEVVEAGERKQALLTRVGTIGAVILTIAASFGFWDFKNTAQSIDAQSAATEAKLAELQSQSAELEEIGKRVKIQGTDIETEIARVKTLSDQAEAAIASTKGRVEAFQGRINAHFLLAELNQKALLADTQEGLHFTADQIEEIGNIAQRYDEEEVQELGGLLTSFLADGLQFHAALNEALQSPTVTDAKGRVFLTYFAGLSAIQDNNDPELFSTYRSGLYRFAEAKEASLNRAWLVTNDDRDLLRFVLAAQQDDDSEAARRGRKVDLLVDLMQVFTTEE